MTPIMGRFVVCGSTVDVGLCGVFGGIWYVGRDVGICDERIVRVVGVGEVRLCLLSCCR